MAMTLGIQEFNIGESVLPIIGEAPRTKIVLFLNFGSKDQRFKN